MKYHFIKADFAYKQVYKSGYKQVIYTNSNTVKPKLVHLETDLTERCDFKRF